MHTLEEVAREALGVIPNLVARHNLLLCKFCGTCELIQAEKHKNRQVIRKRKQKTYHEKPREKPTWEIERVTNCNACRKG